VKILRLTNSSDLHPGVAEELRAPAVAARMIASELGEPIETFQKAAWPTPALAGVVARWLDEYEPDVVFVRLSSFWVAYESTPLRVSRRLGRIGEPVSNAGLRIGKHPRLVENGAFKAARRAVVRTVGGDTYFTPAEASAEMHRMLAAVVAHESIVPVVRGTGLILNSSGSAAGLQRSIRRVTDLNAGVAAACAAHRVTFVPEAIDSALSTSRLDDEVHDGPEAHERLGRDDARAILSALQAAEAGRRVSSGSV
jgi:hypothetical protein